MINELKEILSVTHGMGFLPLVKIDATDEDFSLTAIAEDKSVLLNSHFKVPVSDFKGTFGMQDLNKLATIISIPEYKNNPRIKILRRADTNEPSSILFVNETDDFCNDYRFMSRAVVENIVPTKNRKVIHWDIKVEPTPLAIQRLKYQSSVAGNTTTTFRTRMEKNSLIFELGDKSAHAGEFRFADNVAGYLSSSDNNWPISQVLSILSLSGDKTLSITGAGAMEIAVETPMANHQFTILAIISN
jgi:hypothetical protein